jgi:hypothetical protein
MAAQIRADPSQQGRMPRAPKGRIRVLSAFHLTGFKAPKEAMRDIWHLPKTKRDLGTSSVQKTTTSMQNIISD